jgi:hypothetical protein
MQSTAEILDEDDNPRKTAALELAAQGFHVFAVQPKEKRPDKLLSPEGFKDATTDADTVAGWFEVKPKANVGIACGAAYGLVVLDVDVKRDAPGMKTYAELGLGNYATRSAKTPSGGYHLYFRYPAGVRLKPKLPGIDIKGGGDPAGGGYVLAPPSYIATDDSTGSYEYLDPEMPVADLPFELVAALEDVPDAPRKPKAAGPDPVASIKTQEGNRHERLVELGAIYRGKGLSEEEIEALLWHYATEYFDPPFNREDAEQAREIEAVVRWYAGKAANAEDVAELAVLSTADLFALADRKQAPPLCDPILPPAGNMMIYGPAGGGKSHLANALTLALARAGELLEWTVAAPLRVLFVDGEMPLEELKARMQSYLHGTAPPDTLGWLAARAGEADLPDLADPAAQERYTAAVRGFGAQVVFFDNLTCLRQTTAEAPENAVEAWYPVQRFLQRLNALGIATVTVHHASKGGSQRGSSAHTAIMDTVLKVAPLADNRRDPNAAHDIEVTFEKHRRFFAADAEPFRATCTVDLDDFATWRREASDPLLLRVVELRKAGQSVRDIARALSTSKAAVQRRVERAKSRGLLPLGGDE